MNIIEAAKTGKRIRVNDGIVRSSWYGPLDLIPREYVDRDWEVEETPITLTRSQFEAAYSNTLKKGPHGRHFKDALADELGFGEG